MGSRRITMIDERFGRWTVIKRAESGKKNMWLCKCDCGTFRDVYRGNLRSGKTHCVTEWARILKMDVGTLRGRIRLGWSINRAFTTPIKNSKNPT